MEIIQTIILFNNYYDKFYNPFPPPSTFPPLHWKFFLILTRKEQVSKFYNTHYLTYITLINFTRTFSVYLQMYENHADSIKVGFFHENGK